MSNVSDVHFVGPQIAPKFHYEFTYETHSAWPISI